jgi:hypothetical protein
LYTFVSMPDFLNTDAGDLRQLGTWRTGPGISTNDKDGRRLRLILDDIVAQNRASSWPAPRAVASEFGPRRTSTQATTKKAGHHHKRPRTREPGQTRKGLFMSRSTKAMVALAAAVLLAVGFSITGASGDNYDGTNGADVIDTADSVDTADTVNARAGNDVVTTHAGNDTVEAGRGNDQVSTGLGDDTANGSFGDDRLELGDGTDTASGGENSDHLIGQAGGDTLRGNFGADTLNAGSEADTLVPGGGTDLAKGGPGNDTVNLAQDSARDDIRCGDGDDTVNYSVAEKPAGDTLAGCETVNLAAPTV